MVAKTGGNRNTQSESVVTTVTINSVTATEIAADNPGRLYLRVSLDSGITDVQAFIREYAAGTDNIKHGELLTRITAGNNNLFNPVYKTFDDKIYTGPVSAISVAGTFDLHIQEG
ncbi:MAG: hypothetical protein JKY95_19830 [Planctomycetaceae bacterium]|nr:hypothetical protein [Planctomycetaceae bacterium]